MLSADENKEYLPIDGDQEFVNKALKFAYGQDAPLERIAGVQTLSGTGACRIGGQFLSQFYKQSKTIYVPDRKFLSSIFGQTSFVLLLSLLFLVCVEKVVGLSIQIVLLLLEPQSIVLTL
jgi:hypothetical protein